MSADCASSVALVVNELVQNALKYAFPSGQAGRIGIELHSGRPLCQLTVTHYGVNTVISVIFFACKSHAYAYRKSMSQRT